ncbi:MAG: hypothetical protein FJ087_14520 [Deltaproteobacteria bacterium]|nr:hypothetical protein [Deltaproteobacteria bacterium]
MRLAAILVASATVLAACSKPPADAGASSPAPGYSLGKGWRAAVAADPAVLGNQGTDAWVRLWENDLLGAVQEFKLAGGTDEASAGAARALISVASFLRAASRVQLALEVEAAEYRVAAAGRIEPGVHTPLVLGWALLRTGAADKAAAVLKTVAPEDRPLADKLLAGVPVGEVVAPAWREKASAANGKLDLWPLVEGAKPLFVETVRDGGNEASLRHRDPDLLAVTARAASLEAIEVVGKALGAFAFLECEAAAGASHAERVASSCSRALQPEPVPWFIGRFGVAETDDDLAALARARRDAVSAMSTPGSDRQRLLVAARDAGAMGAFVLASAAWTLGPAALGDVGRDAVIGFATERLAEVRAHVDQTAASWTGPGATELKRMQAAERQGAAVATAAAETLMLAGGRLHLAVQGLESVYAPGRASFLDARHSPEYLVMLAAAYFDANRFPEGIGILRSLEATYPVIGGLREVAELVSVQRSLDTRGAARRE